MRTLLISMFSILGLSACTLGYDLSVYDGVGRHWQYGDVKEDVAGAESAQFLSDPPRQAKQPQSLEFADGGSYEGDAQGGLPHGYGTFYFADGAVYSGSFWRGVIHGQGRMEYPDGRVYEGQLSNGLAQGTGLASRPDGETREGQFNAGEFASGRYVLASGVVLNGRFQSGELVGPGMVTGVDGVTYLGVHHHPERHGLMIRNPGRSDEGYEVWRNGELLFATIGPTGLGAATPADCNLADAMAGFFWLGGECRNGQVQGEGVAVTEQRTVVLTGRFQDGAFVEGARLVLPPARELRSRSDIDRFLTSLENQQGIAVADVSAGGGVQIAAQSDDRPGDLVMGRWQNGWLHGKARVFSAQQLVYDGDFSEGQPHGEGVCLIEGRPQRCEHYQGERIDAAWLYAGLSDDLEQVYTAHESRIESIEAGIAEDRRNHQRQFEQGQESIRSQIRRQQTMTAVSGSLQATAASMRGDNSEYLRQRAEMEREVARLQDELDRRQEEHARDQQERERRWAERRASQIQEAIQRRDQEEAAVVARHRQACERLPGRRFTRDRECVRASQ